MDVFRSLLLSNQQLKTQIVSFIIIADKNKQQFLVFKKLKQANI